MRALSIPARHVLEFMAHHRMLQVHGRPEWRVVSGGSAQYLRAFERRFRGRIVLNTPVERITRDGVGVTLRAGGKEARFDRVFVCTHGDDALALLDRPSPAERSVLGAIRYHANRAVVHGDTRLMPRRRPAWSSWNVMMASPGPGRIEDGKSETAGITYWMNRLQGIDGPEFFVTLNPLTEPDRVFAERTYRHPVFDRGAERAQLERSAIDGVDRIHYCGAYWGYGFHEDGYRSAIESVARFTTEQRDAA